MGWTNFNAQSAMELLKTLGICCAGFCFFFWRVGWTMGKIISKIKLLSHKPQSSSDPLQTCL